MFHENCKNAAGKFEIRFYLFIYFLDDLHLQIIESISPKASVENSSAQWATFVDLPLLIYIEFFSSNRYQNCLGKKSRPPTPLYHKFVFRGKIEVSNTQLYFILNVMVCIVESTALSHQNIVASWRA